MNRVRVSLALLVGITGIMVSVAARGDSVYELDGAVDINYQNQTNTADNGNRVFTDVRPGLAYQIMSERVIFRFEYLFSGLVSLDGAGDSSYQNHAAIGMTAQLGPRSTMNLVVGVTQGGTSFQQSATPADTGNPQLRNLENPDLISSSFAETLSFDAAPDLRLFQSLAGNFSTPQDETSLWNLTLLGAFGADHLFKRDAVGLEFRPSFSFLHPTNPPTFDGYASVSNALLARWGHDFSPRWTALATLGAQQVVTFVGSQPIALIPTGGLTVGYQFSEKLAGVLTYNHAATTDTQTGSVAESDLVTVRGNYTFGPVLPRIFSASAGYLHSQPIGQSSALVASGVGSAVQADAQFSYGLAEQMVAMARYSMAYQFGQPGAPSSIAQVILVGLTGRYGNDRLGARMPGVSGQRVDGGDSTGFPDSEKRR